MSSGCEILWTFIPWHWNLPEIFMSVFIISFEAMCLVFLILDIAELVWGFLISMKIQESPPVKNYDIYWEKNCLFYSSLIVSECKTMRDFVLICSCEVKQTRYTSC